MPDYETLVLSIDDGIARLTLNRPRAMNSLNLALVERMSARRGRSYRVAA